MFKQICLSKVGIVSLTITMLSLAANATISAQETTPLHMASSLALALSMTSYPCRLGSFAGESFSAEFPGVESTSTDPSQP
jgi:hypothetical protein